MNEARKEIEQMVKVVSKIFRMRSESKPADIVEDVNEMSASKKIRAKTCILTLKVLTM